MNEACQRLKEVAQLARQMVDDGNLYDSEVVAQPEGIKLWASIKAGSVNRENILMSEKIVPYAFLDAAKFNILITEFGVVVRELEGARDPDRP